MRRRTLSLQKEGVDGSTATPLSVIFANKNDGSLVIVESEEWSTSSYPASTFEPIGIVVIPGEHGVLKSSKGKNQCGVMSIVPMDCDTPTNGGTSEQAMFWGQSTSISAMTSYNQVVVTESDISNEASGFSSSSNAYIPRQGSVGGIPKRNSYPYAPSPYIGLDYKSGGYNESYGTVKFDTSSNHNCLADFDGRGNTDKILAQRGPHDYSSWKPTFNTQASYPAASCCDMFYTAGTKQGDWYLPAAGELGYIIPRFYDINDTIGKLNTAYGVGVQLSTNVGYQSSSQHSSSYAYGVYTSGGKVDKHSKNSYTRVRAFMRL